MRLRTTAGNDCAFALRQLSGRIAHQTSGISNRRKQAGTRNAVSNGDVAAAIHRNASHPAMVRIGGIGSLLEDLRRRTARIPDFVPANSGLVCSRIYSMRSDQRFVISKITISKTEHQAIADPIELFGCTRLWNAIA